MAWVWPTDQLPSEKKTWKRPSSITNQPKRPQSERMEYDFSKAPNYNVNITSPFGTNFTPEMEWKLVSSHWKPHITKLRANGTENPPESYGPRVPPVQSIAENPTKVDPRLLAEGTKGYYSAQRPSSNNIEYGEDSFSSNLHKPPTYNRPRPDSKTLSPYKNLPPIRANRSKNQMSTVFESEPWVQRGVSPRLQDETEYKNQYHDGRPLSDRPQNGYHSENNFKMNFQSNEHFQAPRKAYSDGGDNNRKPETDGPREFLLQRYLPTERYDSYKLPSDPVTFSAADEDLLMDVIGKELSHISPANLENAYIEATKYDRQFMDWCSLNRLEQALMSQNAAPALDTLRLVASMFRDPNLAGMVNYKEILKFLSAAMQRSHPDRFRKQDDRYGDSSSKYYSSSQNPSIQNLEPFKEKETAKLLRMVHEALNESGYRLDIEQLHRDFQSMDNKRETLSKAQINHVLYQNRVPLQESLVDHILQKFQQSNGQYNWYQFVSFLEKVQSIQTGLPMPQSKRPLEYAKDIPNPHDSWPRPRESPRQSPPHSHRNGYYDSNDYRDPPLTDRERRIIQKLRHTEEAINELKNKYKGYNSYRSDYDSDRERRILDKLRKTEDEINDLRVKNKDDHVSPSPSVELESERERRIKNKISRIEDDILDLKFKDQGHNSFDKENREKQLLEEIKKTKDNINDMRFSDKPYLDRPGKDFFYKDTRGQIMREGMELSNPGYSWSDKLLKLSGQLYAINEYKGKSSGALPYTVITEKTMEFNKHAHMGIPYDVIVRLGQEYKNSKDEVDIFKFLDHLGNRYRWYKA